MIALTKRLSAVLSYVPAGAKTLDVGTDHALIPISLLLSGAAEKAYASDINRGPLDSAAENAARFGVSDRLELYLSDGLTNCRCAENGYDAIVIAGMGGQTIVDILAASEYPAEAAPTLILQPMTMQYELRRYLSSNGFDITTDRIVPDGGKFYTLIVCRYTGEPYELDERQLTFGRFFADAARTDGDFRDYLRAQRDVFEKIALGKKSGGLDTGYEDAMLECIRETLTR